MINLVISVTPIACHLAPITGCVLAVVIPLRVFIGTDGIAFEVVCATKAALCFAMIVKFVGSIAFTLKILISRSQTRNNGNYLRKSRSLSPTRGSSS